MSKLIGRANKPDIFHFGSIPSHLFKVDAIVCPCQRIFYTIVSQLTQAATTDGPRSEMPRIKTCRGSACAGFSLFPARPPALFRFRLRSKSSLTRHSSRGTDNLPIITHSSSPSQVTVFASFQVQLLYNEFRSGKHYAFVPRPSETLFYHPSRTG